MSFGQRPVAASGRAFNCPKCGGPVALRAVGISVTAVCQNCGSIIDAAAPELKIIQAATAANFNTPLSIGARGELEGVTWEVIGCMRKSVGIGSFRWEEYLLFNPWHGFRFLSQADGHWTLFKRLNRKVAGIGTYNAVTMDGVKYSVFNKDTARVDAVKGEFYWRVKTGDQTYACDYVRAPAMLSSEQSDDELNVSLGRYVSPAEMKRAFPDVNLPWRSGVGACQPFGIRDVGRIMWLGGGAVLAAICVHVVMGGMAPDAPVLSIAGEPIHLKAAPVIALASSPTAYPSPYPSSVTLSWDPSQAASDNTTGESVTSQPFDLSQDSNLRIDTQASLDNAWADFDLTLVNETTGRDFDIHQGISYYHGVDDGESWSEGRTTAVNYTPVLPKGRYHLLIDTDSDVLSKSGQLTYTLDVHRGVAEIWNLWTALLLLAIYPLWVGFRYWTFESARWSNSDYAPSGILNSGGGDD